MVINYGEERRASDVLPLQKGEAGKVLANLKGGTESLRVVLIQVLEVLKWRGGGVTKKFPSFKGGGA